MAAEAERALAAILVEVDATLGDASKRHAEDLLVLDDGGAVAADAGVEHVGEGTAGVDVLQRLIINRGRVPPVVVGVW